MPRSEAIWTRRGSALALARGTVALARFVNQAAAAWPEARTGRWRRGPQARARSRRSRRGNGGAAGRVAARAAGGSAIAPVASRYRRREPERTLLHATVRAHWKTFLAEVEERGEAGGGGGRGGAGGGGGGRGR